MDTMVSESKIVSDVSNYIEAEMPQVKMHGGTFDVSVNDVEEQFVTITLGGTCSGCGLAPMTESALANRLTQDLKYVSIVNVEYE